MKDTNTPEPLSPDNPVTVLPYNPMVDVVALRDWAHAKQHSSLCKFEKLVNFTNMYGEDAAAVEACLVENLDEMLEGCCRVAYTLRSVPASDARTKNLDRVGALHTWAKKTWASNKQIKGRIEYRLALLDTILPKQVPLPLEQPLTSIPIAPAKPFVEYAKKSRPQPPEQLTLGGKDFER